MVSERGQSEAYSAPSVRRRSLRWALIAAIVAVLTATGCLVGLLVSRNAQTRTLLAQAEAVRTAAYAVALDCIADSQPFADQRGPFGFAPQVREEILALCGGEGELYLLQIDESGYNVEQFLYVQDGFAVHFRNNPDGLDHFTVMRYEEALP